MGSLSDDDDIEIRAFRLCIDFRDKDKCFSEDFWTECVITRQWKWKGEGNKKMPGGRRTSDLDPLVDHGDDGSENAVRNQDDLALESHKDVHHGC